MTCSTTFLRTLNVFWYLLDCIHFSLAQLRHGGSCVVESEQMANTREAMHGTNKAWLHRGLMYLITADWQLHQVLIVPLLLEWPWY